MSSNFTFKKLIEQKYLYTFYWLDMDNEKQINFLMFKNESM